MDGEFVEPAAFAREIPVEDIASVENTIFSMFPDMPPFPPRNPSIEDENDEYWVVDVFPKFHVADIASVE